MPVKIRLSRHGKKGRAYYQIVVADARAPRDGKYIERLGMYDPNTNPATIEINNDKALSWLKKGAQPTDTLRAILAYKGILFKHHLDKGVQKGALSQEQADTKHSQWLEAKNMKVLQKSQSVKNAQGENVKSVIAEESKKREAKAALVAEKKLKAMEVPAETPAEAPAEGSAEA